MGTNKRIKIQIERKGLIDLFEDINIPITKVLSDIRDLSKRSGGYSTSIEVPGSKNNLQLFGHLYDINITNSTFSLKKKYKCVVIKDDIEIFYGYIRMEGINKYEGPDGETLITFNISLHDDVSNFYMKIKDKFINPDENIDTTNNIFWDDLVISKYNYSNIISTFDNTVEDKFKFFLPYQNRGYYQTTDFKPAVYVYEYLDRIISSAGYTWNGSKGVNYRILDTNQLTFSVTTIGGLPAYAITPDVDFPVLNVGEEFVVTTSNQGNNKTFTISYYGTSYILVNEPVVAEVITSTWYIKKNDNFLDKENWDILNNTINLDKLVIPYAGSSDLPKTLSPYDVYAGYNPIKYSGVNGTFIYSIGSPTTGNTIGLGVGGYTPYLAIGDLLKIEDVTNGTFYFEIQSIINTSGSLRDYGGKLTDSNGLTLSNQSSIPTGFHFGLVIAYWPSKFFLRPNTYVTYPLKFEQTFNLPYKLESSPYYDRFNQLSYSGYNRNRLITPSNLSTVLIDDINAGGVMGLEENVFTTQVNGNLVINTFVNYNLHLYNNSGPSFLYDEISNSSQNWDFIMTINKNGVNLTDFDKLYTFETLPAVTSVSDPNVYIIQSGFTSISTNNLIQVSTTIPVVVGDIIKINYRVETTYNIYPAQNRFWKIIGCSPSVVNPCGNNTIYPIFQPISSNITYKIKGNIQEDDINIPMKYFIPRKIKQSDLLLGLCKIFNLFIDYDEQKKQLLILPRDQYYELGNDIDWSKKIDISNKNNFQFYPDLKYKNYIYTYKLDSDDYSKSYNENVKEIYGQVNVKFENDLLDGTTTIDNIFYSTPIARVGGNSNIYDGDCSDPLNSSGSLRIPKNDGNLLSLIDYTKTTNLKLLYDNGLISDAKSEPFVYKIQSSSTLPTGYTYVFTCNIPKDDSKSLPAYNVGWIKYTNKDNKGYYLYPQIGHFLNGPTQPSDDLNYAQCDYYFYDDIPIITQNNLFYKHFLRTIRQQRDCKLLKARIHLSPAEVNSIRFYDKFYVFDTYWVLNKFEYNEDGSDLYNVELINVI